MSSGTQFTMLNSTQQENILCTVILTYAKVHTAFTNILAIGDEFCQHFNSEVSILSKGKKKKKGNDLSLLCNPAIKVHFSIY